MSKTEIRKKTEARNPNVNAYLELIASESGLFSAFGFRHSDFGF